MNVIPQVQNEEQSLKLLAAQRALYSRAKTIASAQAAISIVAPVVIGYIGQLNQGFKPWGALIALGITLVDLTILEPLLNRSKKLAATIQEQFDLKVLCLSPNPYLGMLKTDPEDWALQTVTGSLHDWYPKGIADLPLVAARTLCQRTNCWWDGSLRGTYAVVLYTFAVIVALAAIAIGMWYQMPMDQFVIATAAPAFPTVVWALKEAKRQSDASQTMARLKALATDLWNDILNGKCSETQGERRSRQLQDAIFNHRAKAPFVFDFIYWFLRDRYEGQMTAATDQMLSAARSKGLLK